MGISIFQKMKRLVVLIKIDGNSPVYVHMYLPGPDMVLFAKIFSPIAIDF